MSNVFAAETRSQMNWMNEPESWSYTEEGVLIVEAQADTDFFRTPRALTSVHPLHSWPYLYRVILK